MQKKSFHIYLFKELGLSAKGVNDSTISLLAIALEQQIAVFILEALGLSVKETKILQDWLCCCTLTFQILHFEAYRIGANTTALLIITASRVNSNTKAPKLLNLNNTTAS